MKLKNDYTWEQIRKRVIPILLSQKHVDGLNDQLKDGLVRRRFLDLFTIYMAPREENRAIRGLITKTALEEWDISPEELHRAAAENVGKIFTCTSLDDLISAAIGTEDVFKIGTEDVFENHGCRVYIISTTDKSFGTAAILATDKLSELADDTGSDLYVLPASIHEALAVPAVHSSSPGELLEIVTSMNASEFVGEKLALSSSVYRFRRLTREITLAATEMTLQAEGK